VASVQAGTSLDIVTAGWCLPAMNTVVRPYRLWWPTF